MFLFVSPFEITIVFPPAKHALHQGRQPLANCVPNEGFKIIQCSNNIRFFNTSVKINMSSVWIIPKLLWKTLELLRAINHCLPCQLWHACHRLPTPRKQLFSWRLLHTFNIVFKNVPLLVIFGPPCCDILATTLPTYGPGHNHSCLTSAGSYAGSGKLQHPYFHTIFRF